MVTRREVENTKNEILLQKMKDSAICSSRVLNPFIRDYAENLGIKFSELVFEHRKIANNGFLEKSLAEQLQDLFLIKPIIEEIADLANPNHPHIAIAKEMAKDTFYDIMKAYKSALNNKQKYLFV